MNASEKVAVRGVRHPKARITLTLPADLFEKATAEAAQQAMPVSTWMRAALAEHLRGVSDTRATK